MSTFLRLRFPLCLLPHHTLQRQKWPHQTILSARLTKSRSAKSLAKPVAVNLVPSAQAVQPEQHVLEDTRCPEAALQENAAITPDTNHTKPSNTTAVIVMNEWWVDAAASWRSESLTRDQTLIPATIGIIETIGPHDRLRQENAG